MQGSNPMVSLRDYEGVQGFGMMTEGEVENLNKALSAGSARPPSTNGDALRVESLEATLRAVTFSMQHVKLWKKIDKIPAYNTVEEYNLLTAYGADAGSFTNEGDLPETQDSSYQRKVQYVKFMGTTRQVTHPMTLVRPAHGNVIGLETQNGAIWLVERTERALFGGDSTRVSQSWDGLFAQIMAGIGITDYASGLYPNAGNVGDPANTVIIDKRGADLEEGDLETAANYIVQNYGVPTDLHCAPYALSQLAKQLYPRQRMNLPAPDAAGKVGAAVKSFESNAGLIDFNPNIFLRSGGNNGVKTAPAQATSAKAPSAPTLSALAAGGAANSKFTADDAGAYYYVVTAINRFGESAPSASANATAASGGKITLTITDGGGTYPATGYKVYRSAKGAADATKAQYVQTVKQADLAYVDLNWFLPGCSTAYLVQQNIQNMSFKQLAPMLKIPLATIDASIRWMQLLYGTPVVYTPKKNVIFINVGDV